MRTIEIGLTEEYRGLRIAYMEDSEWCPIDLDKVPQEHLDTLNEVLRPLRAAKISSARFSNDIVVYYVGLLRTYLPIDPNGLRSICRVLLPLLKIESEKSLAVV